MLSIIQKELFEDKSCKKRFCCRSWCLKKTYTVTIKHGARYNTDKIECLLKNKKITFKNKNIPTRSVFFD